MAPVSYLFRIHAGESPGASCDEVKDKTCGLVDATSVRYIVPGYFQRIGPMKGLELKVPPLALVFLAGGCMWLITRAVPAFGLVSPAHVAPAVGVVIIGLVIAGTGIVSFRMAKTTVNPMKPESSSTLVVTGIYSDDAQSDVLRLLVDLVRLGHISLQYIGFVDPSQLRPLHESFPNRTRGTGAHQPVRPGIRDLPRSSTEMDLVEHQ